MNQDQPPKPSPSDRLAEAFDRWRKLDQILEQRGPSAISPEQMHAAWQELMQAYEEWSNSR